MINTFGYDEGEKGFMKRRFLAALLAAGMVLSNCNVLNASDAIAFSSTEESSREVVEASSAQEDIYYVNDEILPAETTGTMDDLNEMLPVDEAIAGLIDDASTDPAANDPALADQIADESDEIPDMPETEADFSDYMIEEATEEKLDGENTDLELEAAAASVAQAIWTSGNTTLTFHFGPQVKVGDSFNGSTVTNVWSGTAVTECGSFNMPGPDWTSVVKDKVTKVIFDTSFSQVRPTRTWNWFSSCSKITSIDLRGLNTSEVTDMNNMFYSCTSLETLDVSAFDTSSVTNMYWMFGNCTKLKKLDISGFDTSNVTTMGCMFRDCSSLTELSLGGTDTSHVTDMSRLFEGCKSLKSLDVSGLDTSSANFMNYMFSDCSSLKALDVSHFVTSSAKNMSYMFAFCSNLEKLDVSSFDISGANIDYMFHRCSGLREILCLDPDTRWRPNQTYTLFSGCTSLVGTAGDTKVSFDSSKTDSSMAKSAILGGYFSPKLISLGTCSDNITWKLDKDGTLTLSGSGPIPDYKAGQTPPWYSYRGQIKTLIIEDGITSIGEAAFYGCSAENIEIADSVVSIGDFAFMQTKLIYVWIPENVKTIGERAFYECSELRFATVGKNVKQIKENAFGSCGKYLATFYLGTPQETAENAFSGCGKISGLYAPERSSYWTDDLKNDYGAESITWKAWSTEVSFEIDEQNYTVAIGESIDIYALYQTEDIPIYAIDVSPASSELLDIEYITRSYMGADDSYYWYNGVQSEKVTGRKNGQCVITIYGYTPIDRTPVTASAVVTVTDTPADENLPGEISNQIKYPITGLYSFSNLTDEMNIDHYRRYFGPVHSERMLKYSNGTGGQCFGMVYSAAATVLFNQPMVRTYLGEDNAPAKNLWEVKQSTSSSATGLTASNYIKCAHAYQVTTKIQKEHLQSLNDSLEDLYGKVVDFVEERTGPVEVFVKDKNSGAHSLLALGIGKNTEKYTEIVVYDCNWPGLSVLEHCKLILYKTDGKYNSWKYDPFVPMYEYSSKDDGIIKWTSDVEGFIEAFGSTNIITAEMNYNHLVTSSTDGVTVKTDGGSTIQLKPQNTDNLDTLIPITVSADASGTESSGMYWLNLNEEYTVEAPAQETALDIASPNSGAAFTLPANGKARVRVSDDAPNSIGFLTQNASRYVVTFSNTDSEGTGVDTRTVSVDADSTVTVTDSDDGIVVSGDGLNSITIESAGESATYAVPDNANLVLIDPDNPDQKVVTADLRDLSTHSAVTLSGSQEGFTFTGEAVTPAVTVRDVEGRELTAGTDYEVTYENNVEAGTASVLITGKGDYSGTAVKTFTISKADNTLSVSGKTATLKSRKLKKKKQSLAVSKVMSLSDPGQGTLSYQLVSVKKAKFKKYFKIDVKSGKVTVKKKLKKGTYTITVNVTASGDTNHSAATKTAAIKIKVK